MLSWMAYLAFPGRRLIPTCSRRQARSMSRLGGLHAAIEALMASTARRHASVVIVDCAELKWSTLMRRPWHPYQAAHKGDVSRLRPTRRVTLIGLRARDLANSSRPRLPK